MAEIYTQQKDHKRYTNTLFTYDEYNFNKLKTKFEFLICTHFLVCM